MVEITTKKPVLVTGAAGFIGMHTCQHLIKEGFDVIGIDNLNSYYDVNLKHGRLKELGVDTNRLLYNQPIIGKPNFTFIELDIQDAGNLMALFARYQFEYVIHLAAQAGVRYSITNPRDYIDSNIIGYFNLLECCRNVEMKHLVYASSSSVYGNASQIPFKVGQKTDEPISLYAATKKSNELMAYTYANLYQIPITGLRFFTVYGPWGRPDMAYYKFTKAIIEGKTIEVYGNGKIQRDFTYVADIVTALAKIIVKRPKRATLSQLFNIGNENPVSVTQFIQVLEQQLNKKAILKLLPMQAGDVEITYADTTDLANWIQYKPSTSLASGLSLFIEWYKEYANERT